jgi:hypothetical protein
MKKLLLSRILALLIIVLIPHVALAAFPNGTGPATTYNITITQVEICQSAACGSSTILGSNSRAFDIASGEAGGDIGQFANADGIPEGVAFSHVRVTLNRAITITGQGTTAGLSQSCSTSTNTQSNATTFGAGSVGGTPVSQTLTAPDAGANVNNPAALGGAASGVSVSAAEYSSANITILNATSLAITYPLTNSFTRQAGDLEPRVEISIDTASALGVSDTGVGLGAGNCVTYPREPTVRVNISIP